MKQKTTHFLKSLFYSKNSQIRNQAKVVYASLTILHDINQGLARFEAKQPKFSDLKIGFNNYKSALETAHRISLIQLARLNSLLAINQTDNLFNKIIDNQNQLDQQLDSVAHKMNSYISSNNLNQEKLFRQGLKKLS